MRGRGLRVEREGHSKGLKTGEAREGERQKVRRHLVRRSSDGSLCSLGGRRTDLDFQPGHSALAVSGVLGAGVDSARLLLSPNPAP